LNRFAAPHDACAAALKLSGAGGRDPGWARKEKVVGNKLTEDAELFFGFARNSLIHAALKAGSDIDKFVLLDGIGTIATGLEILSAEVKVMHKEIADIKALLQQAQRRSP